jgi:hypothetical protein
MDQLRYATGVLPLFLNNWNQNPPKIRVIGVRRWQIIGLM